MRKPNLSLLDLIKLNIMKTAASLLSAFTFALAMLSGFSAPGLTVTNFATTLLTLNGSAAGISNGVVLRLTPSLTNQAGSAFLPAALPSNLTFSTSFRFRLSNAGGTGGGEGIAFVLQSAGASALGASGAYMGYGGLAPSLAIEFDTHNNTNTYGTPGDISSNHVAFNTNGTINDPVAVSIATRLNNSNIWYAWVDYTGTNGLLELRLAQTNGRPATATLSQTNFNLRLWLSTSNVFAGFTGGTGAGCNDQDVLAWQLTAPQPFLSQSITNFPAISSHASTDTVILSAAASSGLPVSFSVAAGPGVISSNTLTFTGPGLVSVVASQAGDTDWQPAAPLTNTFQVKNNQAITFPPIAGQVITNVLKLNATASSGLPVTFTLLSGPAVWSGGTNLTFSDRGMVTVMASQAGDTNNWPAMPVTNTFRVYALYTLTVVSPFGTTLPGAGPNVIVEDTVLTPRGIEPPTVTDGAITQYLCIGWIMTGNAPFAGNRGSFAMTVTNNATLTWFFKTNYYFHDSFESGLGNWNHTGTWGLDTASSVSPTHAAADSPGAYYTNNSDTVMAMIPALSLTGMAHPVLHFWSKYDLEDGYDFIYVEGSTNGGAAWFAIPGGTFTGAEPDWTEQQLDLSAWGAATAFQARFHLVTDASVIKDGWDMDDVHIGSAPDPLTAAPAISTANSVTLSWTASEIGDFAAYRVFRSMTAAGQPWHDGLLVGTITGQDATTFVDVTVAPKTRYYYQIVVVNVAQLFAFSGVIPATTAIGMDYPFLDNGEGGGGVWVADAPWALTTEDAVSPTHSWSDSPDGNYANGIAGQSLTLSSPMSFLTAVNPVLTFTHKYALGIGDYVNVEASTNHGADWALLASYSGNSGGWVRGRCSLSNYAGQAAMLVRFRLTSDTSGTGDGWHIDDISVTEGLTTVNPVTLDQVMDRSLRVNWLANTQGTFHHYAIFRATNPAVGISSTLAGIVTNQNTTSFTDTGLAPNTPYYYQVYAVNSYGGYSMDAAVPASVNTRSLIPPFADDFEEASPINFAVSGNWGLTSFTSHSGLKSLTDSPIGNYTPNGDDGALMQLDLSQAQWPVLRFWDRYAISANARGAVDVAGRSMYIVSGTRGDWQPQAVDLTWWAGQVNVPVKFRLKRWNNEQADGWYVDDVSVAEQVPAEMGYPFYDGFEQGLGRWLPGPWHLVGDYAQEGLNSVFNRVTDDSNVNNQYSLLSLGGTIDLTNALNPQLVFWWRGSGYGPAPLSAQVYAPGLGWATVWQSPAYTTATYGWTRVQVSLAGYVNRKIRLAFYTYPYSGNGNPSIWLDKVGVGGIMPGAPTFASPAQTGFVTALRPTLTVTNAVHAENFLLTYRFEVYSDANLSNLVAQVPVVAGGAGTTSWPLDINLADNARYWWRCRASYDTNAGPWMPTATFFVNSGGTPPLMVTLASPANESVVPDTNTLFCWFAGVDPDVGDFIQFYDFQVDDDPAFGTPQIDGNVMMAGFVNPLPYVSVSVPLGQFAGTQSLQRGSRYFWRVRSQDGHGMLGPWSSQSQTFYFASLPSVGIQRSGEKDFLLQWSGPTNNIYLEAANSLAPAPVAWTIVAGPLTGNSVRITPSTNQPAAFYRLRSQ